MKIITQTILLLAFVSNVSCSKKVHVETKWQSSKITVDGDPSDWNIPLRLFDSNTKLNYEITNNYEGIFFAFRINEMSKINQFNQNGITIELNAASSKKSSHTLKYPVGGGRPMRPLNGEEQAEFNPQDNEMPKMDEMPMQQVSISLKGLSGYNKEVVLAMEEVTDIKASHYFDMENEQLFCEIFIPYKSINPYTDNILENNSIYNIILSLGSGDNNRPGPPPEGGMHDNGGMQGPPGQGGPPPGGGMPGGGMNGEGQGGPPDMNNNSQSKTQNIKLEVQLAKQPTE
ncbi:hypothetical protein [Carboxylicivirga caseinilyticus]|uniref:hypothetical protein n=1 Tax=Carboxylicivirga caseinilyticus TaxID=3417572 RepID=UPI003D336580|nr:hypothetical protein [Marinilabiliaceae bacterium A049]